MMRWGSLSISRNGSARSGSSGRYWTSIGPPTFFSPNSLRREYVLPFACHWITASGPRGPSSTAIVVAVTMIARSRQAPEMRKYCQAMTPRSTTISEE